MTKNIAKAEEYGDEFDARMGAEAVRELLLNLDLDAKLQAKRNSGYEFKTKIRNFLALKLMEAFRKSK